MSCGCSNNCWGRPGQNCGCGQRPPVNPCMEKAREIRAHIDELEQILECATKTLCKLHEELEEVEKEFDAFVEAGCVRDLRPREEGGCGCGCNCGCPTPRPQPRCGCTK